MDHPFVHILVFGLLIQTVQASQVLCANGLYRDGGECHKCPDNCLQCVSSMNCTRCDRGFYDSICDKPCKKQCPYPHTCHKEYGFCKYGCPDGQYSTLDNQTCLNCIESCEICESLSVCFRCKDGKYGETCHKCPEYCLKCVSKTNCTQCKHGYYDSICDKPCKEECPHPHTCHKVYGFCPYGCLDGQYYIPDNKTCGNCTENCEICESLSVCSRCKDGKYGEICQHPCSVDHCVQCEKSNGECLQCKDSFYLVDGQCKSCPFGCRQCNAVNNCLSCEDNFWGPTNGSCLIRCPDNDVSTCNVYNMTDRCRIVQDTDINTCDVDYDRYTCATSGYCLQNTVCSKAVKCVAESTEETSCAIDMQYMCDHECRKVFIFLICKTTCSVRKKESGYNISFCLEHDFLSGIVEPFKKIYKGVCHRPKAERCSKRYFMDDVCHKCPVNCLECVSDINCTLCMDGFYGSICEIPCKENCTRSCHKVNGYCLYKSSTSNDPKYRESCEVKHCVRCEQSRGECLQCKDTFFLVDGQCKRCPYGCRLCNTANNCLSCEEEFFGSTNGSCLFKCPANNTPIYPYYVKNDQCRIVQDTDINTCDADSYNCSTSGNCLQSTTCLNSVKCVADSIDQTACAIDMQYNCHHECQKVYTVLACKTTCSVRKKESGNDIPFCLGGDSLSRIYDLFMKISKNSCSPTKDTIKKTQVNYTILALAITVAVLTITIIGGTIFAIYRYKKPHSDCSAAQSTHSVGDIEVAYNHRVGKLRRQTSHVSESGNPVSQCDTNASPDGDNNGALTEETPLNPENNHCSDQRDYKDIQKYPEYKCRSVSEPNKVLLRKL